MIAIELPRDLADDLRAERLAIPSGTRTSTTELLVHGLTAVTTTISLLQGPDTVIKLVTMIKNRYAKSQSVQVDIKGPRGRITFEVTDSSDLQAVAKLVEDGLFGDRD